MEDIRKMLRQVFNDGCPSLDAPKPTKPHSEPVTQPLDEARVGSPKMVFVFASNGDYVSATFMFWFGTPFTLGMANKSAKGMENFIDGYVDGVSNNAEKYGFQVDPQPQAEVIELNGTPSGGPAMELTRVFKVEPGKKHDFVSWMAKHYKEVRT